MDHPKTHADKRKNRLKKLHLRTNYVVTSANFLT
jgi:hypothetical protein